MSLPDLRVEFRTKKLEGNAFDKRELLLDFMVRFSDVLQIEKRDPYQWESTELLAALGAMQAGWYGLAAFMVDKAMAPPEERAEQYRDPRGDVTRSQLDQAIWTERHRDPHPGHGE